MQLIILTQTQLLQLEGQLLVPSQMVLGILLSATKLYQLKILEIIVQQLGIEPYKTKMKMIIIIIQQLGIMQLLI